MSRCFLLRSCVEPFNYAFLRAHYGSGVNEFLKVVTGLLLIAIPSLLLFQGQSKRGTGRLLTESGFRPAAISIGLLAGFLVGMTSIGSGTITMMLLLLIFPLSPVFIVGTDIAHAVVLTGFTSVLHMRLAPSIQCWWVTCSLVPFRAPCSGPVSAIFFPAIG